MQLATLLNSVGLRVFPCAINYNYAKQKWEKHPLTVNREHWADTAARPLDDPDVSWGGATALGIPVPEGVVILDGDHHKEGCTTEAFDAALGVKLDWQRALIQTTVSGGAHYAFRAPSGWRVKQGSNVLGRGSGLDTRTAGRGFICSGDGYTPAGTMGVAVMAYPHMLPELPEASRGLLEHIEKQAPASTLPVDDDRDLAAVTDALRFVDPTERDTWRDVGFALKHYWHDDEGTGYELWDQWSRGEFWQGGCPPTYDQDTQYPQWSSFKAIREGATITIGTLFHMAMRNGWQPPARFDTAAAFGEGAAPAEAMNGLVQRILEEGADSRNTESILADIRTSGCNELQAVLLRNELKAALRSAKLLDKDLAAAIDKRITPTRQTVASGEYSKNHTLNARLFLQTNYPDGTLLRSDQTWYGYNGQCWSEIHDDEMRAVLAAAMEPSLPQASTISGTLTALQDMAYRPDLDMHECPEHLIVFQNGVLDARSATLLPHHKDYLTTSILPYSYSPGSPTTAWTRFLLEVFEGDNERIALLQEWMGYMLTTSNKYQKVMLFIGPKRAGKSTIGEVLAQLVGRGNYSGASLSSFAVDSFINSVRHKTVAFSGDTEKYVGKNIADTVVARIKKISGGDYVDFDRKYKDFASCRVSARITLSANHVPRVFDDSDALASRLLILTFERSFYGKEDVTLIDKLRDEIEGIALWALEGLYRLEANRRFTLPAASEPEMQFISEAFNPLRTFIDTACTLGGEGVMAPADIYEAYRKYALNVGEDRIMPRKVFVSAFKDATRGHGCKYGPHRVGNEIVRGFKGVAIAMEHSATAAAFVPQVVK